MRPQTQVRPPPLQKKPDLWFPPCPLSTTILFPPPQKVSLLLADSTGCSTHWEVLSNILNSPLIFFSIREILIFLLFSDLLSRTFCTPCCSFVTFIAIFTVKSFS